MGIPRFRVEIAPRLAERSICMSITEIWFSFSGRISRKTYWLKGLLALNVAWVFAALVFALTVVPAHAGNHCQFILGFATLREMIGHETVGACLENQRFSANGNAEQRTTRGLMVWRKADNWTAFTDGYRTWINGPNGVVQRLNTERFAWEAPDPPPAPPPPQPTAPPPPPPPPSTPIPRPVVDPKLAHAYHVMRRSETGNDVASAFARLNASAVFGNLGNSLSQYNASQNRITINRKYQHESYEALAYLLVWPTLHMHAALTGEDPASWRECMLGMGVVDITKAQYWLETFGPNGKRNPSEVEDWANFDAWWLGEENFTYIWLNDSNRRNCEEYGIAPEIDPDLKGALYNAMYDGSETGKSMVESINQYEASVVFGSPAGLAAYSPYYNSIIIHSSLRGDSQDALAAIIIHEAMHLLYYQAFGEYPNAAACLEDEITAFRTQGRWWYERYGAFGKRRNVTQLDRSMNNTMQAWRRGTIKSFVLNNDFYQEQCLGGTVN